MIIRTRVMTLLMALACGLVVVPRDSIAQQANGAELHRLLITRLLLDENIEHARLGARSIAMLPDDAAKQPLADLAAEQLTKLAETDPTLATGIADLVGWDVNVLGTNVGRYRDVLNEVRSRFSHPKLLKRIDLALASPDAATVEKYTIRRVDFAAVKAEADRQWAENRRRDRSLFTRMQPGADLDVVLARLGAPDAVSATDMRIAKRGRTRMLTLHYAQSGFILFKINGVGTEPRKWQAFEFVDELFDLNAIYLGKDFGMAQAIAGLRGTRFRDFMMYNARVFGGKPELIPVFEQRLLTVTVPADDFELDAMRLCLRHIYQYQNSESMESLRRLAAAETEPHVKKSAGAYVVRNEKREALPPEPRNTPAASAEEGSEDDAP